MALEGSLKEFNLADILQLIYFQKKIGVLTLQNRTDKIRVLFHDGNIVGAESRRRGSEDRLGNVLVRREIITEEQLSEAIERQKTDGGKFGSILVSGGFTTKEQIQEVIKFQISEIMGQIFAWKEGRYEFTPQGIPLDREIGVSLSTEHYLMEGLRMLDEWSEISHKITIETIYVIQDHKPQEFSDEEHDVLRHIDSETDVGMLSEFTGKDSFSVSTTLLALEEKGVVTPKVEEIEEEVTKKKYAYKPIPVLGAILGILFLLPFVVSLYFSITKSVPALMPYSASEQVDVMRFEVETHKALNGRYPITIEGTDPWGNPLNYIMRHDHFDLYSSGPDGNPNTEDDIN